MPKQHEKFRFNRLDIIGTAEAETDTFLNECFVDTDFLPVILNPEDHRNIIVGRTGAGKTALLRQVATQMPQNSIILNPEQLALGYISNTTIIPYLTKLGVNLEIFYKLLWTHSFTVNVIRQKYGIDEEAKAQSWLQKILLGAEAKRKRHAIDYLNKWGAKFWVEVDQNVREITKTMERQVKANITAPSYFKVGDVGALRKLSEEEKQDLRKRAQDVVNSTQIQDLHNVLELLNTALTKGQDTYFILIDKLDEQWVEDKIRFNLIKALIESARDFNSKTSSVKVVIALRHDLLRSVFLHTRAAGHQQEKYESRIMRLQWTRDHLKEILSKRVRTLISSRYTSQPVSTSEIIVGRIKGQELIDYMIDRTLMRPRDIIKFFNCVIARCDGRAEVRSQDIRSAESEYSESRFNALSDEWFSEMPNLPIAAQILRDRPQSFKLADISEDEVLNTAIQLQHSDTIDPGQHTCRLFELAERFDEGHVNGDQFRKELMIAFYEIGLVDLKLASHLEAYSIIDGHENISPNELTGDTRVIVHKAFWRFLGIQNND